MFPFCASALYCMLTNFHSVVFGALSSLVFNLLRKRERWLLYFNCLVANLCSVCFPHFIMFIVLIFK